MRSLATTRAIQRLGAWAAGLALVASGALIAPVSSAQATAPAAAPAAAPLAAPLTAAVAPAAPTAVVQAATKTTYNLDPAVSGQGVTTIQIFEQQINALRAKKGLKPLKFNLYATQDAYNWSKTMAAQGIFRHTSSVAERPSMKRFTGTWAVWGENVGVRSNTDTKGLFQQWVDSPGHLANMLSAEYDSYGIGFYIKRSGDKGPWALYGTTVFYKTKPGKTLAGSYANVAAYQASRVVKPAAPAKPAAPKPAPKVAGGSVSIKGTARVGSTLKASVKRFSTSSVKVSYRWYRNGKAISRATKSSYRLAAADRGKRITVKVKGSRSGYVARTVTSRSTAAVKAGVLGTKAVKISGAAKVGRHLSAKTKSWAPGGVKASYRWYRNGKAIAGATKRTYVVKRADRGKRIKVKVTGSKSGYTSRAVTSASTSKVR